MSQIYEKFVTHRHRRKQNITVTKITDICDNLEHLLTIHTGGTSLILPCRILLPLQLPFICHVARTLLLQDSCRNKIIRQFNNTGQNCGTYSFTITKKKRGRPPTG